MDESKEKNDDGIKPINVKPEDIRSLNNRITNLERVMDTIDSLGEKFENGVAYFIDKKNENDEKQRIHVACEAQKDRTSEEKALKKGFIFAILVFITFMAFCFTAFIMGEKDIAMNILAILLALGAGGSVAPYFVKK